VVVDGNVITSQGPATAMEFAVALVGAVQGADTATKVAEGLLLN
jgi:4-methyl-5(b-hydroxyethyl)-thiazole monophosphate biosynthesis